MEREYLSARANKYIVTRYIEERPFRFHKTEKIAVEHMTDEEVMKEVVRLRKHESMEILTRDRGESL